MGDNIFKEGERVVAVKARKGKQTLPEGTTGEVIREIPGMTGLYWVRTDKLIRAPIGTKKGTPTGKWKEMKDFFVCAEEIRKIGEEKTGEGE